MHVKNNKNNFNYVELPGLLNNAGIRARLKLREIINYSPKKNYYNLSNLIKIKQKQIGSNLLKENNEKLCSKNFFYQNLRYLKGERNKNLSTLLKDEIKRADNTIKISSKTNKVFNNCYSQKFINKIPNRLYSSSNRSTSLSKDLLDNDSINNARCILKNYSQNSNNMTQIKNQSNPIKSYLYKSNSINDYSLKSIKHISIKNKLKEKQILNKNKIKKSIITIIKPKVIFTSYGFFSECPFQHSIDIKKINNNIYY